MDIVTVCQHIKLKHNTVHKSNCLLGIWVVWRSYWKNVFCNNLHNYCLLSEESCSETIIQAPYFLAITSLPWHSAVQQAAQVQQPTYYRGQHGLLSTVQWWAGNDGKNRLSGDTWPWLWTGKQQFMPGFSRLHWPQKLAAKHWSTEQLQVQGSCLKISTL